MWLELRKMAIGANQFLALAVGMVPSGKRLHNYGKSPFSMGKLTSSMAMFNSYVSHYQEVIEV